MKPVSDNLNRVNNMRVLVVDDHPVNRLVLREQLKPLGCRIDEAVSGIEAMKMLRLAASDSDPYGLAILDMQMPGMDGGTLGRKIKSEPALDGIVLVMLTSMGDQDTTQMEKIGFSAYLTKPIKASQLYSCLASVFGANGSPAERRNITTRYSLKKSEQADVRLLLVEDNRINQVVAMHVLSSLGYDADIVENGLEAVKALEKTLYAAILMDIQMPEMDGLEATGIIRDPSSNVLDHDVRIIAMTAHAMKGDRQRCRAAGMDDYVTKPIDRQHLQQAIERQLAVRALKA